MNIDAKIVIHDHRDGSKSRDVELALASLIETIHELISKVERHMTALTDLQTEVSETKTVVQSAIVLIRGFKAALDEAIAAGNPEALTALSAELDASTNELAAAVTDNTPAPARR